ncbi:hypothetical protein PILCRDRAFT_14731 [Piloderma croceum F 1598]|uniref:Uncharacterized protein n=1 Tax=Piloderma croceum (strain F 1598) TaxID=765440 RepID=A0A0C3B9V5_PILCF|nr:hypothetical protein PILCRDRAFT_14731 [Piloderma croceum F 1598]
MERFSFPPLHPITKMFRSLGMFSVVAISNFLLRHPGIHELQFVGGQWMDFPLSSLQLRLPLLNTLQGYLYEIFFLLKAILSPPVLCTLRIETDPPADLSPSPALCLLSAASALAFIVCMTLFLLVVSSGCHSFLTCAR